MRNNPCIDRNKPYWQCKDAMPPDIPGQVYLCQVSKDVSCGACCGLYNIPDLSQPRLTSLLQRRTEELRKIPRTEDDLDDFALQELRRIGDDRPYPNFHHCPFLGLIGPEQSRVGCLLHPLVPENKGIDLRGYSFYGAAACRLYFCPSYSRLPDRYKLILQVTAPDWYLYGLLITEHRLLQALFSYIEEGLGRRLTQADFEGHDRARHLIQPLLTIKETWPYRSATSPGPCHYIFEDGEYTRPGTMYACKTQAGSPFSHIFDELDSAFNTRKALHQAEADLEALLSSLVQALS